LAATGSHTTALMLLALLALALGGLLVLLSSTGSKELIPAEGSNNQ